jgi:hypothetical protein
LPEPAKPPAVAGQRLGLRDPDCGRLATFAEDGSPFNKVAGLGFGGVPSHLLRRVPARFFAVS